MKPNSLTLDTQALLRLPKTVLADYTLLLQQPTPDAPLWKDVATHLVKTLAAHEVTCDLISDLQDEWVAWVFAQEAPVAVGGGTPTLTMEWLLASPAKLWGGLCLLVQNTHVVHRPVGIKSLRREEGRACRWVSQPAPSAYLRLLQGLLHHVTAATQDTKPLPGHLNRSQTADQTATFCIETLLSHSRSLSEDERREFRRSEKEALCRTAAEMAGLAELIPAMTRGLFTDRVIPEVNRQMRATGEYVRPRRPKKTQFESMPAIASHNQSLSATNAD